MKQFFSSPSVNQLQLVCHLVTKIYRPKTQGFMVPPENLDVTESHNGSLLCFIDLKLCPHSQVTSSGTLLDRPVFLTE